MVQLMKVLTSLQSVPLLFSLKPHEPLDLPIDDIPKPASEAVKLGFHATKGFMEHLVMFH